MNLSQMKRFTAGAVFATSSAGLGEAIGLTWSDAGDMLFSVSNTGVLQSFSIDSGKQVRVTQDQVSELSGHVAWTHAKHGVLVGMKANGGVRYWSLHDNRVLAEFVAGGSLRCLSMSPANDTFLTTTDEGTVTLWDLKSKTAVARVEAESGAEVAFDPSGEVWALGLSLAPGSVKIRLYASDSVEAGPFDTWDILNMPGSIRGLEFSADAKQLALSFDGGKVVVVDAFTGDGKWSLGLGTEKSVRPSWSSDGMFLCGGMGDGTIGVWKASDGEYVMGLEGHRCSTPIVSWSPERGVLASGGHDAIVLWSENR